MNQILLKYLKNLKQYGIKNNIPNVSERLGRFLNMLVKIQKPKHILEIGCANGYSTIWLAEAAKSVGGKVITLDFSKPTFEKARHNLEEIELSSYVNFYFGDALEVIPGFPSDQMFEFIFVDGEKARYLDFWHAIEPRLSPHAVIVFDDMMAFPEKTKPFSDAIRSAEGFEQVILPIEGEDGILLLIKN